jgi:hypothetical protein
LAYLLNKPKDQCTLESRAVVKEFQDVFPTKLTSLLHLKNWNSLSIGYPKRSQSQGLLTGWL